MCCRLKSILDNNSDRMDGKMSKFKNKNKKIILFLAVAFLIIFFSVFLVLDNTKFNKGIKKYSENYKFKVTLLVLDKDKVKDKTVDFKHFEDFHEDNIGFINVVIPLEKKDNYLYADLKQFVNTELLKNISDYTFTNNNLNGELIDECEYDKKLNQLKIPVSYYKNKTQEIPVQTELLSIVKSETYHNLPVNIKLKKVFTKEKEMKIDASKQQISLSISNYKSTKVKKKNIKIYLNNNKKSIDSSNFTFDGTNGLIVLNYPSSLVNDIRIKIDGSIFSKVDFLSKAEAVNWTSVSNALILENAPNISAGTSYVVSSTAGGVAGVPISYEINKNDNQYHPSFAYDSNGNSLTAINAEVYGAINLGYLDKANYNLYFTRIQNLNGTIPQLLLYCSDHSTALNAASGDRVIQVTVTAITNPFDNGDGYKAQIFRIDTTPFRTQKMTAYFKVKWKTPSYGQIKVEKKILGYTVKDKNNSKFTFTLYNSDCNTKASTTSSNPQRIKGGEKATWKGLEIGKSYCIKESLTSDQKSKWKDLTTKIVVALSANSNKVNGIYTEERKYTNRRRWWATKVYKYSSNYDGCNGYINGAKFTLFAGEAKFAENVVTGGAVKIVNGTNDNRSGLYGGGCGPENGMAVFAMLDNVSNYKVQETSDSKYTATVKCGNKTRSLLMKNTNPNKKNVDVIKEMSFDSKTGKYKCTSFSGTNILSSNLKKINNPATYCFKVKKVDSDTGNVITDGTATFKATLNNSTKTFTATTDSNGIATFMVGTYKGKYTVKETSAPNGYSVSSKSIQVETIEMNDTSTDKSKCTATPVKFENTKKVLNWYKESKSGEMLNGAGFKVYDEKAKKYVKVKSNKVNTTKGSVTKSCYQFDTLVDNANNASVIETYNTNTNGKTSNGEVCIAGVTGTDYKIIETKAPQYHTFGTKTEISLAASSTSFYPKVTYTTSTSTNYTGLVDCETEFELTKKVDNDITTDTSSIEYKQTTKELKKLKFNVKYGSTILWFKKLDDGSYRYAKGVTNLTRSMYANDTTLVQDLTLDDNRKIYIRGLPHEYEFKIVEKESTDCKDLQGNECESLGFYYIEESESQDWTIKSNSSSCNVGPAKTTLTNTVTEINFTKKDIYSYLDGTTQSEVESKLEDEKEVYLFDTIDFVLNDSNGRRLKLKKIGNVGTCTVDNANNGSAYALYRYVLDTGETDTTEIMNTYCGNIKIKHLCRESSYTIEEISVPNNSVFILPTTHPTVTYTIGKDKTDLEVDSETHIIENTPTRVLFQKRDLKYGNIISETVGQEKTTFNVYRCDAGISLEECTKDTGTLIKFSQREVIKDKKDNEDYGKEVYRYVEGQTGTNLITDLHPYKGDLILRYLPGGEFKEKSDGTKVYVPYNYILVEKEPPAGYDLPTGGKEITRFTVNTETVDVDVINVVNKPTKVILRKYDAATGELLTGAKFKVYRIDSYDQNRTLANQQKTLLKLKTIRDGEYEYRDNKDTDVITTCTSNCNEITQHLVSSEFTDTEIGEEELTTEVNEGEAVIQYLDSENYYLIEEVEPKEGYSLPDDDSKYALVYIPKASGEADATVELYNEETYFQFYKFDEYNNLIDGAEFKLQKLNSKKKYVDVGIDYDEEMSNLTSNAEVYRVNEDSDNVLISTKSGSAIIYRLTAGQYRILEVKAPEGKELPKKTINVVTFFVTKQGKVYGSGSPVITNKAKTEFATYNPVATAELEVAINTGRTRVKWGLIIALVIVAISSLIYFQNKKN